MANVVKLRCNACQDFLKMIIKDGWQEKLYKKAEYEVCNNTPNRGTYRPVYDAMRDKGIEEYTIDNMDVTFIFAIVKYFKDIIDPVAKNTLDMLEIVKDDRNGTNHSSENEEADELYLRALMSLVNLRNLVRAIDKNEKAIPDEVRLAYRRKYISEIDKLKDTLDEERIEIIQKAKSIDRDIAKIIDSQDPLKTWLEIFELYMKRDWKLEKNPEGLFQFEVKASDAGIPQAHSLAANYFFDIRKDYDEGEKRLWMMLESSRGSDAHECKCVVDIINGYLIRGNQVTVGMLGLIEKIISKGYEVTKTEEGYYEWPKKQK